MPYIKIKHKHRCPLPAVEDNGDIWECDECGRQWKSYAPGNPRYNAWHRVLWKRRHP
jgi:ribosomal protein L37AE/L43A